MTAEMLRDSFAAARVSHAAARTDDGSVEIRGFLGDGGLPQVITAVVADSPLAEIFASPSPVVYPSLAASPWAIHHRLAAAGIVSAVGCPVFVNGTLVAALNVGFRDARVTDPDLVLVLEALARLLGTSLERVRAEHMADVAKVPIVLMTGYDREAMLDSMAGQVDTVLAKPFGLGELRALVRQLSLGAGDAPGQPVARPPPG